MRLIDADALLESMKDSPFVHHALQALTGKMPTVEAFPVEWLINKYGYATEDILKDWESYLKEQAERKEE